MKRVTEGKNDTRKEYELCESIKKIIYKKWVNWEWGQGGKGSMEDVMAKATAEIKKFNKDEQIWKWGCYKKYCRARFRESD